MPRTYQVESDTDNLTEEQIKEGLNHSGIKRYAYILHDKDVANPHWHVVINAPDNNTKITTIAKWFKVPENFVSVVRGKNGFIDMCKYLTHANKPEKYRYDDSEVKANFDWRKGVNQLQKERRQLKEDEKQDQQKLENILRRILNGEIREYNKTSEIDGLFYIKHSNPIEKAFQWRMESMLQRKDRNMNVFYLEGESEAYKTVFAKKTCEKNGWSYYISSSSNDPLENYKGEDVIILDDLRSSTVELADLVKMLDSHTCSTVKSRYRNKVLAECKAIFITTVMPLNLFYKNVFKDEIDPIKQFKRRCQVYIKFEGDLIHVHHYDSTTGEYFDGKTIPNPYLDLYPKKPVTEETYKETFNMLGLDAEYESSRGLYEDTKLIFDENGSHTENKKGFRQVTVDDAIPFNNEISDEGGFLKTPDGIQCGWLDGKE